MKRTSSSVSFPCGWPLSPYTSRSIDSGPLVISRKHSHLHRYGVSGLANLTSAMGRGAEPEGRNESANFEKENDRLF